MSDRPEMKSKDTCVTRPDYDVGGVEIDRVARNWVLWKCVPYGIMGKGPSLKELIILWVQHRFGLRWIEFKRRYKG